MAIVSRDGSRCFEIKFRQFEKTPDGIKVYGPIYQGGEFLGLATGTLDGVDFYDKKPGRKAGVSYSRHLYALASLAAQVALNDTPSQADTRIAEIFDVDVRDIRRARRHKDFFGMTALAKKGEDGTITAVFWDRTIPEEEQVVKTLAWKPPHPPRLVPARVSFNR
ncbi:hypothetical protein [Methylococcus mesophilus]|uniref:hypothetical protein n=1 Tax=Methylococcus mesophilus TaxID=2993564 RepID=UPI00224AC224|nr:hypothetical protein [Methylococcus mesophilus]UZR27876.1 hypothetical protein OOT43_14265 [Methylococcus mesophilus]